MYWRVGCIAAPGPLCGRRFIDNCFLTCDMKIAIFGGGHGVCAAARLSDADHEARPLPRSPRHPPTPPPRGPPWAPLAPRARSARPRRARRHIPQRRPEGRPVVFLPPDIRPHRAFAWPATPSQAGAEGLPLRTALALRAAAQRDNGRTMTAATLLLRVAQARQLNPLIRMLRLCAEDGGALPGFAAGAHIRVQVSL